MIDKYFHQLQVSGIEKKTKDCVAISFEVPPHLKDTFSFKAGQYLTIRKTIQGEELRRSYSICCAPHDQNLTVAVKKLEGGRFSTWANDSLQVGDILEVMAPAGQFILKDVNINEVVIFAAGSGITPILSHINDLLHHNSGISITLFYGNKNFESIIFREELDNLKNKYLCQLSVHHIFSREKTGIPILYGRIDKEKCIELSKQLFDASSSDVYLLCGPNEMVFRVKEALQDLHVPIAKIHSELFNTDGLQTQTTAAKNITSSEVQQQRSEIAIQLDGDIFEFSLEYGGENLLDAALANGADLPYACKGGVCSTCKAKITSGEVAMDVNYALEPEEVEAGYVLLCQSHPRSEHIYIDFDQK